MKFNCHIGNEIEGKRMYLLSMSNRNVDRPFVICSLICCGRAQASYFVTVEIKESK